MYVSYYFNGYSAGETWTYTPEYLIDDSKDSMAYTLTNGDVQLLNSNTCDGSISLPIVKVELRAYYLCTASEPLGAGNRVTLRPIFGGSLDGDNHTLPYTGTSIWSDYINITFDTNAPASWEWLDVQNLDCDVVATRTGNAVYVGMVEIRVTYIQKKRTQIIFIDR